MRNAYYCARVNAELFVECTLKKVIDIVSGLCQVRDSVFKVRVRVITANKFLIHYVLSIFCIPRFILMCTAEPFMHARCRH